MMLRRLCSSVRASERGTAAVELALIAPFLATLIVGVIDLSNAFGRKLQLEQAAQRAIEKIMNTTANDTVEATLQAEAAEQAGVSTDNVEVTFRLECNGAESAADECPAGETQAQWISVAVRDTYAPFFKLRFAGLDADGTYHLAGEAGIRVQ